MSGNVWEWVSDGYGPYPTGSLVDPTGALGGAFHVVRGGSWRSAAQSLRVAARDYFTADSAFPDRGFRVALSAP
ncbi:MAG: hypothetical protein EXR71_21110 [Myxococcales bacterium]|nr:hypothetical protein [Myxococcales bacterium]